MQQSNARRSEKKKKRPAYVLVMCLMVIAIASTTLLTLFNMLRLQTAESHARRQLSVAAAMADAGAEHALAVLIDQPTFRGTIGPVRSPLEPTHTYTVVVSDSAGDLAITSTGIADVTQQLRTIQITQSELDNRRSALGLSL